MSPHPPSLKVLWQVLVISLLHGNEKGLGKAGRKFLLGWLSPSAFFLPPRALLGLLVPIPKVAFESVGLAVIQAPFRKL